MSTRLKLLNFFLKWTTRPVLARLSPKNPAKLRQFLDKPLEWSLRPAKSAKISKREKAGVSLLEITNGPSENGTLLYLHGGAYIFGSAKTHRRFVAHICAECGVKGLSLNYRLAPENPFPAAIDDAFAVYQQLLAEGTQNIILAGDSAGGGLALALLARILAEGISKPACAIGFSPWTDLTLKSKSMVFNDKTEYLLPPRQIRAARDHYAPNDFKNPYASPILANFDKAPPVLIFVGNSEVLLDDAKGMAENMLASGVDVRLKIYDKTPHVWPLLHAKLPEADRAISDVQNFLHEILPR